MVAVTQVTRPTAVAVVDTCQAWSALRPAKSGAFPDDLPTGGSTGWPVVKCCSPAMIQWTAWPPLYRSASGRHHGTACGRPAVVQPDPANRLIVLGAMNQTSMRCGTSEGWS
ncbi:hypothetical protein F4560_003630 [Saccharothrix ecbatanensis]|uniref:Uncharacterized protein n=1 Tax=Saccharothrix ecbatanensis TaxID=1105145 RepID=A0A7W9M1J3_9PSEU|nr:hypothetical protein [Saccharothrix ecbatanensis]